MSTVSRRFPRWGRPIGSSCRHHRRENDRLTTTGWALHLFAPPTISIMSVLMYTEQPQWQGHGQGKHTCRKQSSDRIIKCHDWFSSLAARSLYCVGGVEPYCCRLCCPAAAQELRQAGGQVGVGLYVNVRINITVVCHSRSKCVSCVTWFTWNMQACDSKR